MKNVLQIDNLRIGVIGLGYVGLPLAIALAKHFPTKGLDINCRRIEELRQGIDCTNEVKTSDLSDTSLELYSDVSGLKGCSLFIVTVPTPVFDDGTPDLGPLERACVMLAPLLKPGHIVVFESTVYPGVTEEVCGPLLEKHSGLSSGQDFYLGYSPERINPGDHLHTVEKMVKVVAGHTQAIAQLLKEVFGKINNGKIYVAKNIPTAEAAKVIENAQRDINIGFINEVTMMMNRLGISMYDVLDAAETKWNFLPFRPGFVGGHCIGVDPYYLAHCARQVGIVPDVILAGRRVNEGMGSFIASLLIQQLGAGKKVLVLGLTFKENIPDLRNTKVIDMIHVLKGSLNVDVHDPFADPQEALKLYGISLKETLDDQEVYDGVVCAVGHEVYNKMSSRDIENLLRPDGLVADAKGVWRHLSWPEELRYWTL